MRLADAPVPRRAERTLRRETERNRSQAIMERKAHRSGRFLVRLLVLSFAGFVVAALQRERKAEIEPELDAPKRRERETPLAETPVAPARRRVSTPRRLAVGFALTVIFFAGAAITAGAGNEVAGLLDDTASTDTTMTSASAPDASATTPSADPAAAPAPVPAPETSTETAPSAPADSSSADASADDDAPATGHGSSSSVDPAASAASSDSPEGGGSGSDVAPAARLPSNEGNRPVNHQREGCPSRARRTDDEAQIEKGGHGHADRSLDPSTA